MIVLGIDPGLASTGFGVVLRRAGRLAALDGGVIVTSPRTAPERRLAAVHERVAGLLAEHRPDVVALEALFFGRNAPSAFAVGQARGVVLLAAAQHGIEVREATPSEVKSAITGYGAADKEQVARMVQLVLGMSERPRPDDAADALAIAAWVANTDRAGTTTAAAGVLDRAAVPPIRRGETGYERAIREALATERAERADKRTAS